MALARPQIVLVTGGTGYVASHLILQLLSAGHIIRTTTRKSDGEQKLLRALRPHVSSHHLDRISFFVADLASDDGWQEAIQGCDYVHHVASPFPSSEPKSEDELIRPAREGTLRVLKFSRDANVRRVVMTSSFAAIGYGYKTPPAAFTEEHWSILDSDVPVQAYQKSKALAERVAWDFIEKEGGQLELSVINPTGIFGPLLGPEIGTSVALVKTMMDGRMAACPQLCFGVVDVRDVADLHVRAMVSPEAKGQRYLATCASSTVHLLDFAKIIAKSNADFAGKLPTRELPNIVVRIAALFSSKMAMILPGLGASKNFDNSKAKGLGWAPRSVEQCIADTAESLVNLGHSETSALWQGILIMIDESDTSLSPSPSRQLAQPMSACPDASKVERRRLQNRINKRNSRQRRNDLLGKGGKRWTIYTSPASDTSVVVQSSPGSFCQLGAAERNRYLCMLRDISWGGATAHLLQPERLLCVSQYNLILAMASNASALGISMEDLRHDILSPFNGDNGTAPGELPPALQPTAAQRDIQHHPWIDLCPSPAFRDVLLNRSAEYSDEELCAAMAGTALERPGLIIWGNAWDPAAYEMSEQFLGRYGWLFRNCVDFMTSTNNWRRRRGEAPLAPPPADLGDAADGVEG
ncbi:hypothetical protein NLG97_g7014 [Lecanicillium saksenae]|uniref:Uncharacterized protein n=1 Tax=Lecanicillium saksenae TaxID=468837 RepID=A0ACC1QN09_9HYPO|nr:hypothetical protein NLG97_g7014 [Lecanicillium saksenae]